MQKVQSRQLTEAQLIERLKRGDRNSFETLYSNHKRRVYSLCLRMVGNPAIAEELTQEAFLLVFRRIGTFRGDSAFGTWLHRLTVNVVLMYLRQQRSRGPETSLEELETYDDSEPKDTFGAPDPVLISSVDRIALVNAINELPPGYRVILVLHDIEGYEHNEIAELLGCSVGNTKSQLHKARLKLRRLLLDPPAHKHVVLKPVRLRRFAKLAQVAESLVPHPRRKRRGWVTRRKVATRPRLSSQKFHEGIRNLGTCIVGHSSGLALHAGHQAIEVALRVGDADYAQRGALPQVRMVEFGDRHVEGRAQAVLQAAHHLALVFERLRVFDAQFQGEKSNHRNKNGQQSDSS